MLSSPLYEVKSEDVTVSGRSKASEIVDPIADVDAEAGQGSNTDSNYSDNENPTAHESIEAIPNEDQNITDDILIEVDLTGENSEFNEVEDLKQDDLIVSSSPPEDVNITIPPVDNSNDYIDIATLSESVWILNRNIPEFTQDDLLFSGVSYSELDELGRCGPAMMLVTPDTLATEPRGSIGMIKPSGWQTVRYDFIDGQYLYNRCHLIGYQLGGGNANPLNLITGTRFLNISGMLSFENKVAYYVNNTGNSVLYRATPVFKNDDLLADSVQIEAYSIEDDGQGLSFNVLLLNIQPGVIIDYSDGSSIIDDGYFTDDDSDRIEIPESSGDDNIETVSVTYILNTNTKRFHYTYCSSVDQMKEKNKLEYSGTREELIEQGYVPCGICKP